MGINHKDLAFQLREKVSYSYNEGLIIEQMNFFPKPSLHPILFEEIFIREKKENLLGAPLINVYTHSKFINFKFSQLFLNSLNFRNLSVFFQRVHLFIMAHGFCGNPMDLRILKGLLSYKYPDSVFINSSSNENVVDGDIEYMGKNLANEVVNYLENDPLIGRISFIGYSLGGVIIRASLPYLEKYSEKFYTYISLASPHLGYLCNSSNLVDVGMWVMNNLKNNRCIEQLSFKDAKDIEDCYMYQLSMKKVNFQFFFSIFYLIFIEFLKNIK